jgi:histidinol-phosphate aminotransferase
VSAPFAELAVPSVRTLHPYQPGKPVEELARELGLEDIVKLASNENPLGPAPRAREAAGRALGELALYPDGNGFVLKEALAERHRVSPAMITLGNGSNDVLDLVARVFLSVGREAVFSQHAFAVYPIVTQAVGALGRIAPAHDGSRGPRYAHDLDAMGTVVNERTRVVFIANPNNPTGTWLAAGALEAYVRSLPSTVIVVIDEAYFEYVDEPDYPDTTRWLDRYPNLIVTRTFSKAYGLAGLRVGYALSHPQIAELLNRTRQPYNVNAPALAAACAALEDCAHLEQSRDVNREGMDFLRAELGGLGLAVIPSVANFVCVDTGRDAREVYQELLPLGVITRPVANYGLPDHLRISIGLPAQNERVVAALRRVLGG